MTKAKTLYADTPWGRLSFVLSEDGQAVYVYSKGSSYGGWTIDRFGGSLTAKGIQKWIEFITSPADLTPPS